MKVEAYPFSVSAIGQAPDVLQGLTPQEFLKSKYQRGCFFGLDHLHRDGVYLLLGWRFNFRPFMKKFLVKQHGDWHEIWAPNRITLRKSLYGRIEKVIDLPTE